MRIAVLGAGAVGGTLAALLHRSGHEVEVTARGDHLDAIRENGLRLDGGWGVVTAPVVANAALTTRPELAILTTKAQDAAGALRDNRDVVDGVPLLVVQNGIGGVTVAGTLLPNSPIVAGLALFAASYTGPGHVSVTAPLPLVIGAPQATPADIVENVIAVLRGALPVDVAGDLESAQWTKLLINHVNALPAITGMSVQDVVAHGGLRRILTASMRETVRIARRLGVRFATLQGVSGRMLAFLGAAPLAIGELFPRLLARRMGRVPNPGSTLQSIRRGRATEIDFLNGAVVAAAHGAGLSAPLNALLVELVHEVEKSGTFLAADEVVERCRLLIAG